MTKTYQQKVFHFEKGTKIIFLYFYIFRLRADKKHTPNCHKSVRFSIYCAAYSLTVCLHVEGKCHRVDVLLSVLENFSCFK